MRALQTIAAAFAGAATVLLLCELVPSGGSSVVPSPAPATRTIVMNERQAIDVDALRNELRDSIREELRRTVPVVEAPRSEREPDDELRDPDVAAHDALAVVSTAIDAGRWTNDERERLRAIVDHLHPDDRGAVLQEWAAAVNEQRLRPEAPPI